MCQPDEPPPPEFLAALASLVDTIIARLGVDEARARLLAVPRSPRHEVCPRCGAMRLCMTCQNVYARGLFRACDLTAAEVAQWDDIMALAHELDAQRHR